MDKFLSFCRFIVFDENLALLYQIKGQWQQRRKPKNSSGDSDDSDPADNFTGEQLPMISKKNELAAWELVKKHC